MKVISVIAGGLSSVYPKIHQNVFNEVIKRGLVITEQTYFESALPFMFPIRNRIIAGLSKGTLVVSASKKSGALYTAEFVMENGRDLFSIPYSIGIKSGEGTNDLIKRGAVLVDNPKDILFYYGIEKEERLIFSYSSSYTLSGGYSSCEGSSTQVLMHSKTFAMSASLSTRLS